jgi:hypothetical protein
MPLLKNAHILYILMSSLIIDKMSHLFLECKTMVKYHTLFVNKKLCDITQRTKTNQRIAVVASSRLASHIPGGPRCDCRRWNIRAVRRAISVNGTNDGCGQTIFANCDF